MATDQFTGSDISIVIPSFNSLATIELCLDSLTHQTEVPREIIVVDSSTDGTPEFIHKRYESVVVFHTDSQLFPGPARNLGVSAAHGAIIAFIDADCIASPDWVRQIANRHSEGRQVVGGAIEVAEVTNPISWAGHFMEFREFVSTGSIRTMAHIPSCNLSIRKILFEESGGFPNAYYPQEDLILNYLLDLNGIKIWFDPSIIIKHHCRNKFRQFLSHQHRIGRVTFCSLTKLSLPGSSIARYRWFAGITSPGIGFFKFLRTLAAFIGCYPAVAIRYPTIFALLAAGSVWWARGFASGSRGGLSGISGWNDPDEPVFAKLFSTKINQSL